MSTAAGGAGDALSAGFHAATHDRLHADFSAVGDHACAHLAATFQHAHDDTLAATALPNIGPF